MPQFQRIRNVFKEITASLSVKRYTAPNISEVNNAILRWIQAGLKAKLLDLGIIEQRIGTAIALEGEISAARKLIAIDKLTLSK